MMNLLGRIAWAIVITIYAAISIVLSRYLGPKVGILGYIALTTQFVCLAGWLLRTAAIDSITWKNRVAGFFLPWTALIKSEALIPLLIKNGLISTGFGALVIACDQLRILPTGAIASQGYMAESPGWADSVLYWTTVICWFVMLAAWLFALRSSSMHQSGSFVLGSHNRHVWILLLLPPIAVGASIACRTASHPWIALLIVSIPLTIVLLPVFLMVSVIFAHFIMGKPIRWN
jgi:hypothetical protein